MMKRIPFYFLQNYRQTFLPYTVAFLAEVGCYHNFYVMLNQVAIFTPAPLSTSKVCESFWAFVAFRNCWCKGVGVIRQGPCAIIGS